MAELVGQLFVSTKRISPLSPIHCLQICSHSHKNNAMVAPTKMLEKSKSVAVSSIWLWPSLTNTFLFYLVKTVHFEMKLYNDQHNAQVF
jgi:hypothetical protein